jgi:putative ATPase
MARMVYAGEEPRFIFRRMIVFAAEDVGLADPEALRVVTSAAQAFEYVGLPEGRFHLAEACLYLATAPKSHSAFAFFDALATVEQERAGEVPNPLKDANRDREALGHGEGYLYPHAYRDHWVAQQYLPDSLRGRIFYDPSTMGREGAVRERVVRLREAQLEAMREAERLGLSLSELGGLGAEGGSENGAEPAQPPAAWARRSEGALTEHLHRVREAIFALGKVERQHLVLDANAGGGLLVWEALRRCPQGGVWARVEREDEARRLTQEAGRLSELNAPVVVWGPLEDLPRRIADASRTAGAASPEGAPPPAESSPAGGADASRSAVRFDRILARGVLGDGGSAQGLALLAGLLAPGGWLVMAETVPAESEPFFAALAQRAQARGTLAKELAERLVAAEARVHAEAALAWNAQDLEAWVQAAGLSVRERRSLASPVEIAVTSALIRRWFGAEAQVEKRAGSAANAGTRSRLAQRLGDDAAEIRAHLLAGMAGQKITRTTTVTLLRCERAAASVSCGAPKENDG